MAVIRQIIELPDGTLTNGLDKNTKLSVNYKPTTVWYDGSVMNNSKVDGDLYTKKGTKFYRKVIDKDGELFLEKDTVAELRALTPREMLYLKAGVFRGVKLNGYYEEGDAPVVCYYPTTDSIVDNGGTFIVLDDLKLKYDHKGIVDVRNFGAKADGIFDNGDVVQKAIDFIAPLGGELKFPSGVIKTTKGWNLTSIRNVSNAEPFGLIIRGEGCSTQILLDSTTPRVLFDFFALTTGDKQVNLFDITAYDLKGFSVGLRLGTMSRYSTFDNFRLYGFDRGHSYHKLCYGLTFNNCYIRGCKRESLYVDEVTLTASNVLTEFRYMNCYIDNNGANLKATNGYHINLYNCQEFKFIGTVFEGNFSLGMNIRGISEAIDFISCRMEETYVNPANSSGHIHYIATTVKNVNFIGGEYAYDNKGTTGDKNFSFIYCGNERTLFQNTQIIEVSNSKPTNFLGATPTTSIVRFDNISFGMRNEDPDFRSPIIPKRYFNKEFNKGFIWSNLDKIYFKQTFPTTDTDGSIVNLVKSVKSQNNGNAALGVIGNFDLYIRDNIDTTKYLFAKGSYDGVNNPIINVIGSKDITIASSNNQGSIDIAGTTDYIVHVETT